MALVASASKDLRNRYLIVVAMCVVFAVWFAYDGFKAWPENNDAAVRKMLQMASEHTGVTPEDVPVLMAWPGWAKASAEEREQVNRINAVRSLNVGWHSAFNVTFQQWTAGGLGVATLALLAWFRKVQQRRAVADEEGAFAGGGCKDPVGCDHEDRQWPVEEEGDCGSGVSGLRRGGFGRRSWMTFCWITCRQC